MTIEWQATVTALDSDPDIDTPAGQSVLKRLLAAGRQYDAAGQPDVLHESAEHAQWASQLASRRIGTPEPAYFVAQYYVRPATSRVDNSALLTRNPVLPDSAPKEAHEAFGFWLPKDPAIAKRIARYYIARELEAKREAAPKGPTLGAIQTNLISAESAAQAWLAS